MSGFEQQQDSGKRADEVKPSSCVGEHGSVRTLPDLKFSCPTCGKYMDKPCVHWQKWIANPQPIQPAVGEPPNCGCSEYPECTHVLYWYQGFKAGHAAHKCPGYIANQAEKWCSVCDRPKADCACVENGGTY